MNAREIKKIYDRYYNRCPLCTHRPRVIRVEDCYLTDVRTFRYRAACLEQELTESQLCDGCQYEIENKLSETGGVTVDPKDYSHGLATVRVNWRATAWALTH